MQAANDPYVAWLETSADLGRRNLGGKGHGLATMARAGFAVPRGFCVTARAHAACVRQAGFEEPSASGSGQVAAPRPQFPQEVRAAILEAYGRLGNGPVAVRSSAIDEDQAEASFAGQQETYLNVRGEEPLLEAIWECWMSLTQERARVYRRRRSQLECPLSIAVVVQEMIPCEVAGVAFSIEPVTGAAEVVVEAGAGLAVSVVGGYGEVERYVVARARDVVSSPARARLLTEDQVRQVAKAALDLERLFQCPQDVEWGWWRGRLYLFQSRPITVLPGSLFTDVLPGDDHEWTAGFLNERLPRPVSPLGWSLIRELLESIAFRDPLRFIGYRWPADDPLTKLFRGHPYVHGRVFRVLYRPFPDGLLPEDARRYFPGGRTELRREAPYPLGWWDPRFLVAVLGRLPRESAGWRPAVNHRVWARFERAHDEAMTELGRKVAELSDATGLRDAWGILLEAQALNARLLSIHRWSLTHADISYSLLRRLLARWLGSSRGGVLSARLISGLPNKSTECNQALATLARTGDWAEFCAKYGHRSFSLDVYQPTFGEMPDRIRRLAPTAACGLQDRERGAARELAADEIEFELRGQRLGWMKRWVLRRVWRYAMRYMPLREDQRFYWQKTLALERRLFLWIGRRLSDRKQVERSTDVFFATLGELGTVAEGGEPLGEIWRQRRVEYERLDRDFERAPATSYPSFLRGIRPLPETAGTGVLQGQPVSPGLARGPARVIHSPDEFDRVLPGDVLVTRGADPGWTPVFGRIAGLVLEVGGQLSHAAVVAREYGLPAVTGVSGATRRIQDGQEIVVDGMAGTVGT